METRHSRYEKIWQDKLLLLEWQRWDDTTQPDHLDANAEAHIQLNSLEWKRKKKKGRAAHFSLSNVFFSLVFVATSYLPLMTWQNDRHGRAVQQKVQADCDVQLSLTSGRRACGCILRDRNKEAWLQRAASGDFTDAIFVGKTTIVVEHDSRTGSHRQTPLILHIMGITSQYGAGPMVIFDGLMGTNYLKSTSGNWVKTSAESTDLIQSS